MDWKDKMKKIDYYGLSDVGKIRKDNEDKFLIADLSKSLLVYDTNLPYEGHKRLFGGSHGQLYLVADGMGGHAAGKRASKIAVDTTIRYVLNFMPWFFRLDQVSDNDLAEELKSALEKCELRIQKEANSTSGQEKMGTTLTMAYVLWPRAYIVHVGDSRCYLFRDSRLRQITRDHTVAQKFVEEGAMEPEEAENSSWSTVLWNVLGGGDSTVMQPEVYKAALKPGDALLLCTDGLTTHVQDSMIAYALSMKMDAKETCRHLVDAANQAGGTDNITLVITRFLQQ